MSFLRLSHIGICVSDLERSLGFYRDLLGFEPCARAQYSGAPVDRLLGVSGTKLRVEWLERDGTRLELLHFEQPAHVGAGAPRAMNALGLTHISLRVDDLNATVQQLVQAGVRILSDTRFENPAHGAAAVFALDPDGTRIELVQMPGEPSLLPGQGR